MNQPLVIQEACKVVGSQAALAELLDVSENAVSKWVSGRMRITAERAVQIEQATDGQVTRYEIRPDVFGPAPAKLDTVAAA